MCITYCILLQYVNDLQACHLLLLSSFNITLSLPHIFSVIDIPPIYAVRGCLYALSAAVAISRIFCIVNGSPFLPASLISCKSGILILFGMNDMIAVFIQASWNGRFDASSAGYIFQLVSLLLSGQQRSLHQVVCFSKI